ncbi:hypothetical protein [Ectothiorhodospira lacustris]|uniref:hypothetical protein n=1 Tax=Ectothiorhodospira lacustris TaxID=2899127 RepID=UPI001EE8428C|nr:hypothetical protein [Ectothiorhodospira lacustris]MCG5510663.1 hypothetical protein [Ectothiorhodospira lacustris]MCG5522437.1 hypothetical protein [Ectothiorhodospira lacustris]
MNTLCITGAPNAEFNTLSGLLFQSGLSQAQPIERQARLSMADWHAKVAPVLQRKQPLGRLWDEVATDLLLANLHQTCWGWADQGSLWALDYWAELEPGIHFLLLTCDPQDYLAHCLLTEEDPDEKTCLEQWRSHHERLLNFYLANPERCLLVNARQALIKPTALLDKLNERWQFGLQMPQAQSLPALPGARQTAPLTLARHLADKTLQEAGGNLTPLHQELQAAQQPLTNMDAEKGEDGTLQGQAELPLASILKDYQRRCAQDLSEDERRQLSELKQENELLLAQLHQVQEELEATFLKHQESEKALQQAKQAAAKITHEPGQASAPQQKAEKALEESQQENELLLLQLHQVQEELENYFLQHQQATKDNEQLAAETRRLKQQLSTFEQEQAEQSQGWLHRVIGRKKDTKPQLAYEHIQLQHEQVNPDYEHLWIRLKNPTFGTRHAEAWSFRLSCAGVRPGDFGSQPKLELPEQKEQLFEHWFEESRDDHGPKLELRFALPDAMDGGVWKKIQPQDQQLLRSLIQQLPQMLESLAQQGRRVSRDWADWQRLAADMQRIHQAKAK